MVSWLCIDSPPPPDLQENLSCENHSSSPKVHCSRFSQDRCPCCHLHSSVNAPKSTHSIETKRQKLSTGPIFSRAPNNFQGKACHTHASSLTQCPSDNRAPIVSQTQYRPPSVRPQPALPVKNGRFCRSSLHVAVSYTHLTLPTNREV